jgi:hypothetical protein
MFTPEALAAKKTRGGGSVVTPNTHVVTVSGDKEYIAIYDVQTPSSITQTANYDISAVEGGSGTINGISRGGAAGLNTCNMPLHVVNGVVYVAINQSIYAYDVSDPTTISELGSIDLSAYTSHQIEQCARNMHHDDRLFALTDFGSGSGAELFAIDITDPSSMSYLGDVTITAESGQSNVGYGAFASGYDSDNYTDGHLAVPVDKAVKGYELTGASRSGLSLIWIENHATNSSATTTQIMGIDFCTGFDNDTLTHTLVSFYEAGKVAFTLNGSSTNTPFTNTGVLDDPRGVRAIPYMSNYTSDRTAFCVAAYDDDALVILTNPDNNGPITVRVDQYNAANNGIQNIDVYDEWIYCVGTVYNGFSVWELTGSTSVSFAGSIQDTTTYLGKSFQIGVIQ